MVQCLKNVGTANPLVLIDEIDKVLYHGLARIILTISVYTCSFFLGTLW